MNVFSELKKKIASDKKALILIVLFFFGIILFALSGIKTSKTKSVGTDTSDVRLEVEKELEERAGRLIRSVEGVGKVEILITVESAGEAFYAKDEQTDEGSGKYSGEYVLAESGGTKTGLVIKTASPEVRGVAVSCEGGGSARIKSEVTSLLCAAFGISPNRVYVSEYGQ